MEQVGREKMNMADGVWVFQAGKSSFASAVFSRQNLAEEWIRENRLTGTLTWYPIDQSAYEWVKAQGYRIENELDSVSIARFSDARQPHYHYEQGVR